MKKVISVLMASFVVLSLLTGCASNNNKKAASSATVSSTKGESGNLIVYWWGNQVRNDRTQQVMKMYHEKYPNVTLTPQFTDWASYWNKLATQVAANSAPDVIQMDYAYIDQYVSKGLLLDMTPYITSGEFNAADIPKPVLQSGAVNKKNYAISLGTNVLCLVYDPAALKKAGVTEPTSSWTWADFDSICTKMNAAGVKAEPLFFTDGSQWVEYEARSAGGSLFSADGKSLGFKDKKILTNVYDRLLKLVQNGCFLSPDKVASITTVEQSPIVSGNAWLSSCWSNQFVALQTAAKRDLTMINMPMVTGAKKQALYDKPSQFFSISSKTNYKDAAIKFVSYFENDIDANKVLLAERGVPTSTKVLSGIKSAVSPATAQTFDYVAACDSKKLTTTIDPPSPTAGSQVLALSKTCYYNVAYQKKTPAQAADDFMSQANTILSTQ